MDTDKAVHIKPKDLASAVSGYESTEPLAGFIKMFTHMLLFVPLFIVAWLNFDNPIIFWTSILGCSLVYASMMITTHDAIHDTFTGTAVVDYVYPRLISYPMFWFHGIYSEVHKLHHKMNGTDLRDPERVQFTVEEFEEAGTLGKFFIRHQWPLNILVFGGVGLIIKTLIYGAKFFKKSKAMRKAFYYDFAGIIGFNVAIYSFMASKGLALQYFYSWVVFQYVTGAVLQFRAHIEHYGLWGKGEHFYDSQVHNCRNIKTSKFIDWYFNGLCHHTIHHAFPRVPFYKLKEAQDAMSKVYTDNGCPPIAYSDGYINTAKELFEKPRLIKASPKGGLDGTIPLV